MTLMRIFILCLLPFVMTSCAKKTLPLAVAEVGRLARLPIPLTAANLQYGTEDGRDHLIYGRFDLPASDLNAFLGQLSKTATIAPYSGYSNVTAHSMAEPWWNPASLRSPKTAEWSEPGFYGNLLMGTADTSEVVTVYFFNFTT